MHLAVVAGDLLNGKKAFGFVADVDDDFRRRQLDHPPADNLPLGEAGHLLVVQVEELAHTEVFQTGVQALLLRIISGRHGTGKTSL